MFLTPTLRNAATRHVFFHNGVFHSLQQVMDFYNFRDMAPEKVYPRGADGTVAQYDDIPQRYRANVDVTDPAVRPHAGGRAGDDRARTRPTSSPFSRRSPTATGRSRRPTSSSS